MLRPRIIPCLLVHNDGLVKTVGFDKPKYVGDPLNAVRIFNEKEVDELIVVDIDATRQGREPNYNMIANLAAECRMPLAYGGGVTTAAQFQRLVALGVEKVAVSAAAVERPEVIAEAAACVGSQSVVVVMDVKPTRKGWEIHVRNGSRATGLDAVAYADKVRALGAGEIVLNSIDRDGKMEGYDLDLVRAVRKVVDLPITVLGGAGKLSDIEKLVNEFGTIGAAAGSLFVFKGVYRAVLINYPTRSEKDAITLGALGGR